MSKARSLANRANDIVSVLDFGARGDGIADDTVAIQNAVNAVSNNGVVIFPAGTYNLGAAGISVSGKTGVTLLGQGATIKLTAIGTQQVLGTNPTSIVFTSCTRSGIQNLVVNGNSIASQAIGIKAGTECFVDGCTVYSSGVSGQVVAAGGGVRNRFTNNIIYSGLGTSRGMWLGNLNATDMETDIYIAGNIVRNNNATGLVVCSVGGRVEANHSRTNEGSGIVVAGANGYSTKNLTIANNYFVDNLFHGIQSDVTYSTDADLTQNITVTGNVCSANNRGTGSGIFCVGSKLWTVGNNVCNDNVSAGIQADDRSIQITITGNTCSDTRSVGQTQVRGIRVLAQAVSNSGITITGNTCNNNTTQGIVVSSTVGGITLSNVNVSGNTCMNNAGWGIFMSEVTTGNLSNINCSENSCFGNTTVDLRLSIRDVAINGNRYSTQSDVQFWDLDSLSATPSVPGRINWRANNSGATTITAFNNGVDGQQIIIRGANGNTTIAQGGSIVNKGAINVTIPSDGSISYMRQGTVWREIFRSF